MSSNGWETITLGDVAEIIMGQSPAGETCNDTGNGTPLLNGPTEFGDFHPNPVQHTTDPKKFSQVGDILFCVRGSTTGRMNWADQEYAIGRGLAAIRHKKGKEFQPFLRGILDYYLPYLLTEATGSTFPNVSSQQLNNLVVDIPPLPTQRRIADILSALDEKIELNRQANATLEALAQSIFREWFVEFRYPDPKGLSREHASSEAMESGENGSRQAGQTFRVSDLPQGWRVGKLGDVVEFAYGKGLKSENRTDGEFPVIGSSGIVGTHNEYLIEGPGIVIGRKGTIGEVTWVHENFFPIDTTFYMKDLLNTNGLYFHYFLLKEQDFKKIASDSAVPGLNRNQAYDNLVIIPPTEAINLFNNIVIAIFANIHNNEQQSATLASAREALLPKLMSGEVKV